MWGGLSLIRRQSASSVERSLLFVVFVGAGVFDVSNSSTVRMCVCGGLQEVVFSGLVIGKFSGQAVGWVSVQAMCLVFGQAIGKFSGQAVGWVFGSVLAAICDGDDSMFVYGMQTSA